MRLVFVVSLLALACGAAQATPIAANYVSNGSFENFTVTVNATSFTGWTITTGPGAYGPGYGPESAITDGSTANRYGDVIAADNASTSSPDAAGTHALYLVDDVAYETLSETVYLPHAGTYEVGFDALNTGSGANNAFNSTVTALIAGVTVVSGNTTLFGTNRWTHESANATVAAAGNYTVTFQFQGGTSPARDIMVDRVYIVGNSTLSGGGASIPVPEPASLTVLAGALAALAGLRRRISRK